jgi:hypothetical protein
MKMHIMCAASKRSPVSYCRPEVFLIYIQTEYKLSQSSVYRKPSSALEQKTNLVHSSWVSSVGNTNRQTAHRLLRDWTQD